MSKRVIIGGLLILLLFVTACQAPSLIVPVDDEDKMLLEEFLDVSRIPTGTYDYNVSFFNDEDFRVNTSYKFIKFAKDTYKLYYISENIETVHYVQFGVVQRCAEGEAGSCVLSTIDDLNPLDTIYDAAFLDEAVVTYDGIIDYEDGQCHLFFEEGAVTEFHIGDKTRVRERCFDTEFYYLVWQIEREDRKGLDSIWSYYLISYDPFVDQSELISPF